MEIENLKGHPEDSQSNFLNKNLKGHLKSSQSLNLNLVKGGNLI
jgi:hypothetical protein